MRALLSSFYRESQHNNFKEMRKKLHSKQGQRLLFTATIGRSGEKSGYRGSTETVLLKDVRFENDKQATDHVWINKTKTYEAANLRMGDRIRFEARVRYYEKGYKGHDPVKKAEKPIRTDLKLDRPSKFEILEKSPLRMKFDAPYWENYKKN